MNFTLQTALINESLHLGNLITSTYTLKPEPDECCEPSKHEFASELYFALDSNLHKSFFHSLDQICHQSLPSGKVRHISRKAFVALQNYVVAVKHLRYTWNHIYLPTVEYVLFECYTKNTKVNDVYLSTEQMLSLKHWLNQHIVSLKEARQEVFHRFLDTIQAQQCYLREVRHASFINNGTKLNVSEVSEQTKLQESVLTAYTSKYSFSDACLTRHQTCLKQKNVAELVSFEKFWDEAVQLLQNLSSPMASLRFSDLSYMLSYVVLQTLNLLSLPSQLAVGSTLLALFISSNAWVRTGLLFAVALVCLVHYQLLFHTLVLSILEDRFVLYAFLSIVGLAFKFILSFLHQGLSQFVFALINTLAFNLSYTHNLPSLVLLFNTVYEHWKLNVSLDSAEMTSLIRLCTPSVFTVVQFLSNLAWSWFDVLQHILTLFQTCSTLSACTSSIKHNYLVPRPVLEDTPIQLFYESTPSFQQRMAGFQDKERVFHTLLQEWSSISLWHWDHILTIVSTMFCSLNTYSTTNLLLHYTLHPLLHVMQVTYRDASYNNLLNLYQTLAVSYTLAQTLYFLFKPILFPFVFVLQSAWFLLRKLQHYMYCMIEPLYIKCNYVQISDQLQNDLDILRSGDKTKTRFL